MQTGEYEYKTEFARSYLAQGKAEGEAKGEAKGKASAVLAVLAARGLAVGETTRTRVLATTDLATLERWITRAATMSSLGEVFAEE